MPKKIILKTKKNAASVTSFLSRLTDVMQRSDAEVLLSMMRKISKKEPVMWGSSLIGFGDVEYRRSNGDVGSWFKIGFAIRKSGLSLYLTCDISQYKNYLKNLGPHKSGVGCLNIKKLSEVDLKVLTELVRKAYTGESTWGHE